MNRLIIIGNGFDLAHKLPTRYSDFVNYYIKSIKNTNHSDWCVEFDGDFIDFTGIESWQDILSKFKSYYQNPLEKFPNKFDYHIRDFGNQQAIYKTIIKPKNNLFISAIERNLYERWVDFEIEYFIQLRTIYGDLGLNSNDKRIKVEKLNKDLSKIISAFEKYLIDVVNPAIPNRTIPDIKDIFTNPLLVNDKSMTDFLSEFNYEDRRKLNILLRDNVNSQIFAFESSMILNFNYTATITNYINNKALDYPVVHIHGRLNDKRNKIIMGFGDESNDAYSEIEKSGIDEFLRYVKSFQYSENANYKKLEDFIMSAPYQVYIIGHSCGLSDRTLLRAIFENENCQSIKVFYRKFDKMNEFGEIDDFKKIVQNISRHFKDKIKMRSKVVHRDLSISLPQYPD